MKRGIIYLMLAFAVTLQMGCGGGGGGDGGGNKADVVPTTPQNVQAILGDGQTTLSWSSVNGAASYNIYWNTTTGVTTSNNVVSRKTRHDVNR